MRQSERITRRLLDIAEDRNSKRRRGLRDGTLTIVLDHNGNPIVVPVDQPIDQPILTYAKRFHELSEDKT